MGDDRRLELAELSDLLNRYLLGALLLAGTLVGCSRPVHGVLSSGESKGYGREGPPALAFALPFPPDESGLRLRARQRGHLSKIPETSHGEILRDAAAWDRWCESLGPMCETLTRPTFPGTVVVAVVSGRDGGLRLTAPRRSGRGYCLSLSRGEKAGVFSCVSYEDPSVPLWLGKGRP